MSDLRLIPGTSEEPELRYDGQTCSCGSGWFVARVVIGTDDRPSGYSLPLLCAACGAAFTPNGAT